MVTGRELAAAAAALLAGPPLWAALAAARMWARPSFLAAAHAGLAAAMTVVVPWSVLSAVAGLPWPSQRPVLLGAVDLGACEVMAVTAGARRAWKAAHR